MNALPAAPRTTSQCGLSERAFWVWLGAAILAVKAVAFGLDHTPMFFLGDSVAYLHSALYHWIPRDRSFLYGWLIRCLAVWTGSLTVLLAAQVLASAASSWLAAWILRAYLGASRTMAGMLGLACALEPLQLLYERYLMTEAFSLLVFAVFTAVAIGYLQRPALARIAALQAVGLLLVALRLSFWPLIVAATVLAPLLARRAEAEGWSQRWRRAGGHLAVSGLLFWGLHSSYKHWNAHLIRHDLPNAPPAYLYDNGFHELCFVACLVEAEDFPDPAKGRAILEGLQLDLRDPRNRPGQRWWANGLITAVKAAYPDSLEANQVCAQTARNAVKRNPRGEVALAWYGYTMYWRLDELRSGLITDRGGDRELPADLLEPLRERFGIDGAGLPHLTTLTNWYYFRMWGWYLALLAWPAVMLAAVLAAGPQARGAAILLAAFVGLTIAVIAACSILPTVRFLHPVAWLAVLSVGLPWGRWKTVHCRDR